MILVLEYQYKKDFGTDLYLKAIVTDDSIFNKTKDGVYNYIIKQSLRSRNE
jgi:hypothetical protein